MAKKKGIIAELVEKNIKKIKEIQEADCPNHKLATVFKDDWGSVGLFFEKEGEPTFIRHIYINEHTKRVSRKIAEELGAEFIFR